MEETFFPTSTAEDRQEELIAQNERFQAERMYSESEIARLRSIVERHSSEINDYRLKIANVAGVIADYYSENGEITDELRDIAKYLGIPLTKEISGTAVYEISWSATVPLDFDADDIEIYFSVECQSDVEDFDWNEDNCEVNGSDD